MITCRELIEFLDDYLAGGPPPPCRARFDEHLAACPDCRNYLDSYEQTVRLGRAAFAHSDADAPIPAEVPESVVRAVLAARAMDPSDVARDDESRS